MHAGSPPGCWARHAMMEGAQGNEHAACRAHLSPSAKFRMPPRVSLPASLGSASGALRARGAPSGLELGPVPGQRVPRVRALPHSLKVHSEPCALCLCSA